MLAGSLIAAYVLATLWLPVLLCIAVAVGVWWLLRYLDARSQAALARELAAFDLAWDADEQNALILAGDPRGVHGRFPPATIR